MIVHQLEKSMRRFLCILLLTVVGVSTLPSTASAKGTGTTSTKHHHKHHYKHKHHKAV